MLWRKRLIVLLAVAICAAPAFAQEPRPGGAVDSKGAPAYDPSKNVLDLVEAAIKRQDDLRGASEKLLQSKLDAIEKLNELRAEKLSDEAKLRAEFNNQLAIGEAKRIDAIRAVDVNAVAVASQRASDQATVLATQVAQSAEALRNLVATTAATVAQSQQQLANTLTARITTLEQGSYQAQGKQTISDPAFISLVAKVDALSSASLNRGGVDTGRSDTWLVFAAVFMGLIALGGFVVNFMRTAKRRASS